MLKIGMSEGIKQGLCHVLRPHIVLSTSELIEELEYEAKENQRKAMAEARKSNPKNKNNSFGPNGPEQKTEPKVTNAELGKIAGVSKSTVTRAKKVKAERTG